MLAAFTSSMPAFAPSSMPMVQPQTASLSAKMESVEDLKALSKKLNPIVGYWNPMGLGEGAFFDQPGGFWGQGQEATIGWLRQSEIKHGRIAMFAFVGFTVQTLGVHFPWKIDPTHTFGDIAAAGGPMDQWDALSSEAKWQIFSFIFLLEAIQESSYAQEVSGNKHYMRGGKPGVMPSLKAVSPHPVPLDYFDPFGLSGKATAERKEQGLLAELNNGRLAMIGIFGCVSASKGLIVPGLDSLPIPKYAGEYMEPMKQYGATWHL